MKMIASIALLIIWFVILLVYTFYGEQIPLYVSGIVAILLSGLFYWIVKYLLKSENRLTIKKIKYFQKNSLVIGDQINNPIADPDQELHQVLKSLKDHSNELLIQNQLLNTLFNSMGNGIFCLNDKGEVVFQNKSVGSFLVEPDSYGKIFYKVIKDSRLLEIVHRMCQNSQIQYKKFKLDTSNHFMEVRFSRVILKPDTRLLIFVLIDKSIDTRLKKERENFLLNASHELKTPVTSIRGYAEILANKMIDEKHRKFVESILANTMRMERLIEDMVSISAIETGGIPFAPVRIDLGEYMEKISELVQGILMVKSQKLLVEFDDEQSHFLFADPVLLEHVLINLLANASRYSPNHTRINVRFTNVPDQYSLLQISDQGSGISNQHKKKIFTRFYRIDEGRSRQLGGTGLGLSIVRNIVRLHKGRIWVEDEAEGGSKFCIKFPLDSHQKKHDVI